MGKDSKGYRRTARLVIVPGKEIRSQHFTEKGRELVTIHTGKFEVVADVDDQGKVHIGRKMLEAMFVVEEPVLPETWPDTADATPEELTEVAAQHADEPAGSIEAEGEPAVP